MSILDTPAAEESTENKAAKAYLKEGKDRFGEVIPNAILPAFTSTDAKCMMLQLNKMKNQLKRALKERKLDFAGVAMFGVPNFDRLISTFKFGLPYCVCRICHGTGCGRCSGKGFQNYEQYRYTPSEYLPESEKTRK